jgi:hypothetical protein
MEPLSKRQERTKGIDMEKINGKGEEIILQKTTHHTIKSGDTMNPNKLRRRIFIVSTWSNSN